MTQRLKEATVVRSESGISMLRPWVTIVIQILTLVVGFAVIWTRLENRVDQNQARVAVVENSMAVMRDQVKEDHAKLQADYTSSIQHIRAEAETDRSRIRMEAAKDRDLLSRQQGQVNDILVRWGRLEEKLEHQGKLLDRIYQKLDSGWPATGPPMDPR